MNILQLLQEAHERGASDLLITIGAGPTFRINGQLTSFGHPLCTREQAVEMAKELMNEVQWLQFQEQGELDFSYGLSGVSRFRINVYRQRGGTSLAIRTIPHTIPMMEQLGLPDIVRKMADRPQGLFLVTGPTGSGKSTTLASIVRYLNDTANKHIITLEDPIEYLHQHKKSIVDQREIGADTASFATGLRSALRQDPDVILVGEMRDLETISTAISAAETGHLVLATLHTNDAPQTIDRMIDVFPPIQQQQIRIQLAANLIGVLSQRLLPTRDGFSRVAAFEMMVNTTAIANLIRQEKVHQLKSVIQIGMQDGMITMEQSLRKLVQQGVIARETAANAVSTFANFLD